MAKDIYPKIRFISFHTNNGEIVFLLFENYAVLCNMPTRGLKMVGQLGDEEEIFSGFLLVQPAWPTPVLPLPLNAKALPLWKVKTVSMFLSIFISVIVISFGRFWFRFIIYQGSLFIYFCPSPLICFSFLFILYGWYHFGIKQSLAMSSNLLYLYVFSIFYQEKELAQVLGGRQAF